MSYSKSDEKVLLSDIYLELRELQTLVKDLHSDFDLIKQSTDNFLNALKSIEKEATDKVSATVATAAAEAFAEQLKRVEGIFEVVEVKQARGKFFKFFKK